jgi:hypothetical protein
VTGGGGIELDRALDALTGRGATLLRRGIVSGQVTDVVLQVSGDPAPAPGAVVLWADVDGPVPGSVAVVVRTADASAADRLPTSCTVLTVPDGERWAQVHERLRSAVLSSGERPDMFAMADALATAVGGAVAIEDLERRILAFSTVAGQPIDEVRREGILGRRVPEHVERDQWYADLWRSGGPVHFEAGPESSPRLALGLRSADERVGSVWVVGDRGTLHPDSEQTLVSSAPSLAAAVVTATGTSSRSREQRSRLLARVLEEPPGPDLDALLPAVVVGIACPSGSELDDLVRARLVDVLSLQAQRREETGLAGEVSGSVLALTASVSEDRLEASLHALLQRTGVEALAAVVSEPVAPGSSLEAASAQVRSLLSLPVQPGDPVVRFAARSRNLIQLLRMREALVAGGRLPGGSAATITTHDREHGTAYAESLLAWFDAHGDVARAAARLHVHANTLRYRWNRAIQLFELDLADGDARLLLHLELRLRALGLGDDW